MNRYDGHKRGFFFTVLCILTLSAALKVSLIDHVGLFEAVRYFSGDRTPLGGWFPTVHVGHNAWAMWRVDPLIGGLAALCPNPPAALNGLYLLFYGIGLATLGLIIAPTGGLRAATLGATLVTTLLLRLFAFDAILLGALAWFPWLTLAIIVAIRAPRGRLFIALLLVAFFVIRLSKGANILAPFVALTALCVALRALTPEIVARQRLIGLCGALIVAILLGIDRGVDAPGFPDYPAYARLVPSDGIPGFTRALVGPDRPLPVIDRLFLDAHYSSLTLGLLLFSAWLCFITRRERSRTVTLRATLDVALALTAAAWWDTLSFGGLSETSPLRTLGRIVPALGFIPLLPLTVGLGVTLLVVGATVAQRTLPLALLAVGLLGFTAEGGQTTWRWDSSPGSIQRRSLEPVRAAAALLNSTTPPSAEIKAALISPSAGLIAREGLWTIMEAETTEPSRWTAPSREILTIETSHRPENAAAMTDGDPKTRWSPERGHQVGDEFVRLVFSKPVSLAGIDLNTGAYATDYPGGIQLTSRARCDETTATDIVTAHEWLGPVRRTTTGIPFYGPAANVEIRFPAPALVGCLEIRQTLPGRRFDWSIAELRLLFAADAHGER
jgi:hypothetical protein